MHVLVILRLGKAKSRDKLTPLLQVADVDRVTVIRHAPVPINSPKLIQAIHEVGLNDEGPPRSRWSSIRNLLSCFVNGWRLGRRDRADVFAAFNLFPYGVIVWGVAHLLRRPVVLSLIGTDFDVRLKMPILGSVLRRVLKSSDAVAVFSSEARQQLINAGIQAQRTFVLPNTVATDRFYPDERIERDIDFLYVGNLHDFKRVDLVLKAFQIVHLSRPDSQCCILGDGSQRQSLEHLAGELGIAQAVRFEGWADNIPEWMRRSRILLLLSEHEGLPAVILEALCTGVPVIATRVGAVASIVQDSQNGYLLPVQPDASQVAAKALDLLTDAQRYQKMREQALATRTIHGYEQATRAWQEILKSLPPRPT